MLYLTNAFSLQMLSSTEAIIDTVGVAEITAAEMWSNAPDKVCAIGHADLAAVAADVLGDFDLTANRIPVRLDEGDALLVAQLTGGRLPEGTTTLPPGFEIEWIIVQVKYFTW